MAELLVDTISFTPKILENSSGNGRLVVEGVFQKADVKNANGRIYPRKLWENVLKDRNILECLETKRMLGNVDHPADSTPRLKGASHIITFLEMMQDGTVIGKAEILETEDGKLIKELLEAGVPVGISSRAKGSLTKGPDGTFIVQESDFKLLTFDFVAAPSTPGAYPKVISESTENEEIKEIQENYMSAREKLNYLEQKAATVLCLKSNDLNESTKPFVESTITDLVIELTKLSSEAPELRGLTESLIHNLNTKRNGIKFDLVEEFPFQKKDDESDEDEDDDEDKKKKKKKKKGEKDEDVKEDTQGSADQGFVRTVPMEPPPPPGEGWAINPGDAGVLADINNSVNNFMEGREDESEVDEDTRVQALTNIALTLVQLQETENNAVARAFAAAYLVEHDRRTTENQAYSRVVEKLQEKIEEGAKTGKIVLSEDSDLRANYDKLVETFDELQTRHRLLAAKVYALQELDKAGLKDNNAARKVIAEAIQRSPTKKAIDEAIMGMASVKGMRQEKKELTESVQNIEGSVAKLNESNSVSDYGLSLAKKLSKSLSYSRAS